MENINGGHATRVEAHGPGKKPSWQTTSDFAEMASHDVLGFTKIIFRNIDF